ncbi:CocE/NonD family hydrolase [Streptomyces sp. AC555_RSS877]|uniref:CocE/NonD family hydrolase n=1 Tax=Streptomyces sp. AC555_RSS877 TaxID=2823688 RepID=UPI001C258B59|nr:CocE/NonD family hydrolase [Streptomyces sp. AC555_RSS877]
MGAADGPAPELRTSLIAVAPHDMHDAAHGSGAFRLGDFLSFAEMVVNQERLPGLRSVPRMLTLNRRLAPVFGALPLADAADAATGHRAPWFREWLTTPERDDAVWDRLKLGDALERVNVPVRLTACWQDLFLDQTLHQYESLRARGVEVSLTVGPGTHQEQGHKGMGGLLRGNLARLETHLADEAPARPRSVSPVEVYVTGQNAWRHLDQWPPATGETVHYLQPGGRLLADKPGEGTPSTYVYDPANPTPTSAARCSPSTGEARTTRNWRAAPTCSPSPLTR